LRINLRILAVFSIIIVCSVASVAYVSFQALESAVIDSELGAMKNEVQIRSVLVESLHSKAREDILFAVANPVFENYYELPDTRAGVKYDDNGVLQFTAQQSIVKAELEKWIDSFQARFHVDETCLIDRTGQEHARLVLNQIAPANELSSSEDQTPFFAPSFENVEGQVYAQSPYVSPDTGRWVFAYTTPIVLSDGSKPAFYHFEMPIQVFQELVKTDVGRMYVIDPSGVVYADSAVDYKNDVGSIPFGTLPNEFFSKLDSNSGESNLLAAIPTASAVIPGDIGTGSFSAQGEKHFIAYEKSPTFGWFLVYEKPYALMLAGDTNLGQLGTQIVLVATVLGSVSLAGVFMMSSTIAKPVSALAGALRKQEIDNLKQVNIQNTTDEVSDVVRAVNEMIAKINMLEKQKDEFASMITHELRTPLTPILGWSQVLKNPKMTGATLNPRQEEAVETIRKSAKRLEALISDMLDAQKLDMKRMRFNNSQVSADEIMKTVVSNFQDAINPKSITLIDTTDKKVAPSVSIKCDKDRLIQVLSNLVANAIDFVPTDTGQIEIGFFESVDDVTFYVKDNGMGIPKAKQGHLFTKFYQADTTVTRKHGGSGLGLAICKGIVESLGGRIWVESEQGNGAAFYFTVPKFEGNRTQQKEQEAQ
jgi:signal transduction histidine kinase